MTGSSNVKKPYAGSNPSGVALGVGIPVASSSISSLLFEGARETDETELVFEEDVVLELVREEVLVLVVGLETDENEVVVVVVEVVVDFVRVVAAYMPAAAIIIIITTTMTIVAARLTAFFILDNRDESIAGLSGESCIKSLVTIDARLTFLTLELVSTFGLELQSWNLIEFLPLERERIVRIIRLKYSLRLLS